jgi:hypothetical protein
MCGRDVVVCVAVVVTMGVCVVVTVVVETGGGALVADAVVVTIGGGVVCAVCVTRVRVTVVVAVTVRVTVADCSRTGCPATAGASAPTEGCEASPMRWLVSRLVA